MAEKAQAPGEAKKCGMAMPARRHKPLQVDLAGMHSGGKALDEILWLVHGAVCSNCARITACYASPALDPYIDKKFCCEDYDSEQQSLEPGSVLWPRCMLWGTDGGDMRLPGAAA